MRINLDLINNDIYELIKKQNILLEEIIDHLIEFLQHNSLDADKVFRFEKQRDAMKLASVSELTKSFINPLRDDIHQAIHSIGAAIDCAKNTAQEMQMMEVTSDRHMVTMVSILKEGTKYLHDGLDHLETNRERTVQSFEELRLIKRTIDKAYRIAISELFSSDEGMSALTGGEDAMETSTLQQVVGIFKRREIYRHIFNAGDYLALAGGALGNLAGQRGD